MANFCEKCGSPIQNDALFCFYCGSSLANNLGVKEPVAVPDTSVDTATVQDTEPSADMPTSEILTKADVKSLEGKKTKKKRKASFWIKLSVAVVLILAVLGSAAFCTTMYFVNRSNIDQAVDTYIEAVYIGNADALEEMYLDEFESEIQREIKTYEYTAERLFRKRSIAMDKRFGNDIFIDYEIYDIKYVAPSVVDLYVDKIETYYHYNYVDIEAAYRVRFTVEVSGDKYTGVYNEKMLAIKLDGEWYLYDLNKELLAYANAYLIGMDLDFDI